MFEEIKKEALLHSEPGRISLYKKYFKCIPGGYGEGDTFAGIRNPILRTLSKKHKAISLKDIGILLSDTIHEIRLLALFILVLQFKSKKTTETHKKEIVALYLDKLPFVNNWDLVDSSAHHILGAWLYNKDYSLLINLAQKDHLWSNRIAIIATFYHIRQNSYDASLEIAGILLHHPHDIIHKAVGWMLREIGNRNKEVELQFLKKHYNTMPRTMLRYAIEKFNEPLRQQILKGTY